MQNIPTVKLGIISVSRANFAVSLSAKRRGEVVKAYGNIYEYGKVVESETDARRAVEDCVKNGVNALVVFLGNFGPETPETLIARFFDGPVMYAAAAEDATADLMDSRGDAFCGMLNCSYNLQLRNLRAYIPSYPVGDAGDIAAMIRDFVPVARALIGVKSLKIFTFGPRPDEFLACNAPIKALYDLGVEVLENSELDLLNYYRKHDGDPRIAEVAEDMRREMKPEGDMVNFVNRLAQYEITLMDWAKERRDSCEYVAFANKCWPAFAPNFGFVPCYVNSRLTAKGIPVSCEVDIYGVFSEFIGLCVSGQPVTLLDLNNSVPKDMYEGEIKGKYDYGLNETFMGFHCGNTPLACLNSGELKYQKIMKGDVEPEGPPNLTRGTIEGDIRPGEVTFFRVQGPAAGGLKAYIAQGEVLPVATRSFGGIGVVAIPGMDRFYRHVLIADGYPHHGAVTFAHNGKALYEVFRYLGVPKISYNQPKNMPYPTENPYE